MKRLPKWRALLFSYFVRYATIITGSSYGKMPISHELISGFCQKHHIRYLALFGSVVRDDFGPESDIDVLVEFEEGYTPGLDFFD